MVEMGKKENFNTACPKKIMFEHDAPQAEMVYDFVMSVMKPFRVESFQQKAQEVRATRQLSKRAFDMVVKEHYSSLSEEELEKLVKDAGLEIVDGFKLPFTPEQYKMMGEEEKSISEELFSKTYTRQIMVIRFSN